MSTKKISFVGVLSEGTALGFKNLPSLLAASILWALTCWIPYINVGTTIAMSCIPIELSKGKVISPLCIFDSKYRRYMGEYFTLKGMMSMAILPAMLFMVIPGIIIAVGWSLALYILLDKEVGPNEALLRSNSATYGHKLTIFLVGFVLLFVLMFGIFLLFANTEKGIGTFVYIFILGLIIQIIRIGCNAVIYRNLASQMPNVPNE